MDFESIIAGINRNGPMLAFAGAAALVALLCFVNFIGKTLARFYAGRFMRGKL